MESIVKSYEQALCDIDAGTNVPVVVNSLFLFFPI